MKIEKLIDTVDATIRDVTKAIAEKKAGPEAEAALAGLLLSGMTLLGEFLIDVKRIADAVERIGDGERR